MAVLTNDREDIFTFAENIAFYYYEYVFQSRYSKIKPNRSSKSSYGIHILYPVSGSGIVNSPI
jgi:hypothetical protein